MQETSGDARPQAMLGKGGEQVRRSDAPLWPSRHAHNKGASGGAWQTTLREVRCHASFTMLRRERIGRSGRRHVTTTEHSQIAVRLVEEECEGDDGERQHQDADEGRHPHCVHWQ